MPERAQSVGFLSDFLSSGEDSVVSLEMSSETETPDSTCSTTDASITPKMENAPASEETTTNTVIVNVVETASAAPSSSPTTFEFDEDTVPASIRTFKNYPKVEASCGLPF